METLRTVMQSITILAWANTIDLEDAYLHVPIHPDHYKYLRFMYRERVFEFCSLPFGLSTSPRVFTRIVKTVGASLRRSDILIFQYLDDWLIVGRSESEAVHATRATYDLTSRLGFLINHEKSRSTPTQTPTYLGAVLDLRRGIASPTNDRVNNLLQCVAMFQNQGNTSARAWLHLLGLMASLVDLVPWCRLFMRPLQLHLLAHFKPKKDSIDLKIPASPMVLQHLAWWSIRSNLTAGSAFKVLKHELVITTDASNLGWGASLPPRQALGIWGPDLQGSHINFLELRAIFEALQRFQPLVHGKRVLIRSDNATAVAYVNHQGGTRSPRLCVLTWQLLHWAIKHTVQIRAEHIPGVDNNLADALSRGTMRPTEWTLQPEVVRALFQVLDRPHVDLFASHLNAQLPTYCTRYSHPQAWATDALRIPWEGLLAYAFPPLSLIPRVLSKIEQESCRVLLIAPFWPRQSWFPRVVRLLVNTPLILPLRPDIIYQPRSHVLHPDPAHLHLTCWTLSNSHSERQAFLSTLQLWPPGAVGRLPERSTTAEYDILTRGARDDLLIRSRHLFQK